MSGKATSLKAKIRNMAREKHMSAQIVMQNFMFEKFIERLSVSDYKTKFVLKGGLLIGSMVGIENRATMDMDTTLKNYPMNKEALEKAITSICTICLEDGIEFTYKGIKEIRPDDSYGGYRASVESVYDLIVTPMHIDITSGDVMTPGEIGYEYKRSFGDGTIQVFAYNLETVLAEKYETILRRGEANTRPRDFYDIFVLTKTMNYDKALFRMALENTVKHRESEYIFKNEGIRINSIEESNLLKEQWNRYQKRYPYATGISYEVVIDSIRSMI